VKPDEGMYPPLFHLALSWLVLPSVDVSIILMRIFSALVVTVLLAIVAWLLPLRYQLVLLLIFLTVFTTEGYLLLASINPSSWVVVGVGVAWLAIHAALSPGDHSRNSRVSLFAMGLVGWGISIGSRWDGAAFVAFVGTLTLFHVLWSKFPSQRKRVFTAIACTGTFIVLILQFFTPFPPVRYFTQLFRYSDDQPDNVAFFTQNLLNGLPKALEALGEVPLHLGAYLPGLIVPSALILLGHFMLQTFNRENLFQTMGFVITTVTISLMFMAWHVSRNERDATELSSRYSLPLLVFAIGWWYLQGPSDLQTRVVGHLRTALVASTFLFTLTIFTIAERSVDLQTFGLRFLPEGLDQWWWAWMPVGPNVVVFLASISFWKFLLSFHEHFTLAQSDVSVV
jgi:hypothetical protein